ncbi:hypothetical protein COOONC_25123 [Cooperia oncophora]
MGSIFAAMALTEVEVYSDPQGKGFDEFIMRALGYGMTCSPNCCSLNCKKALCEQSLLWTICDADEVLDLKHLKKRGGVTEFCLELERLSREAYPDASEEELSRTRAGELVSQLTDWPEYLQLFTTMEIAPKEQAYDMVKAMAQRCERSKQVAAAMRNAMEGHARKSQERQIT